MSSTVKSTHNQRGVRHTPEMRKRALDLILVNKEPPKSAAILCGLSDQTVYNWLKEVGARSRIEWYIPKKG